MFDDVPQSTPPQRPAQDMFAPTAPAGGLPLRPLAAPPTMPPDQMNTMPQAGGFNKKYLLIGGGSLVGLIIILLVVYSLLTNIQQPASVANLPAVSQPINNPVSPVVSQPAVNVVSSSVTMASDTPTITPPATTTPSVTLDSDNDGLTDAQEMIYGADQNNPDTDGDGYQDGLEVNSGYNPMGAGKLK